MWNKVFKTMLIVWVRIAQLRTYYARTFWTDGWKQFRKPLWDGTAISLLASHTGFYPFYYWIIISTKCGIKISWWGKITTSFFVYKVVVHLYLRIYENLKYQKVWWVSVWLYIYVIVFDMHLVLCISSILV